MSNFSQFASGGIKSIQRGTITIGASNLTAAATITAVDPSKTELRVLGSSTNQAGNEVHVRLALTNATTLTLTRGLTGGQIITSWELTEWK